MRDGYNNEIWRSKYIFTATALPCFIMKWAFPRLRCGLCCQSMIPRETTNLKMKRLGWFSYVIFKLILQWWSVQGFWQFVNSESNASSNLMSTVSLSTMSLLLSDENASYWKCQEHTIRNLNVQAGWTPVFEEFKSTVHFDALLTPAG